MRLDWRVLGATSASFLAVSYVLCVSYDLLFGAMMYRAWVDLLPGFEWLTWGSFLLGLVEVIGYGVFFGLVFAPLYNFFLVKVWKLADRETGSGPSDRRRHCGGGLKPAPRRTSGSRSDLPHTGPPDPGDGSGLRRGARPRRSAGLGLPNRDS